VKKSQSDENCQKAQEHLCTSYMLKLYSTDLCTFYICNHIHLSQSSRISAHLCVLLGSFVYEYNGAGTMHWPDLTQWMFFMFDSCLHSTRVTTDSVFYKTEHDNPGMLGQSNLILQFQVLSIYKPLCYKWNHTMCTCSQTNLYSIAVGCAHDKLPIQLSYDNARWWY